MTMSSVRLFDRLSTMVLEGFARNLNVARTLKPSCGSFEDAIRVLNGLQSNSSAIAESIQSQLSTKEMKRDSILRYLDYTGISKETLKTLSVIHIAGTKGKGTTSALCESILRAHGYKTGFYSSPHLISVTERIRLNGEPMKEEHFAKCFDEIYRDIIRNRQHEEDIPPYFGFLTIMALNIFIKENVDVAIVEVGIGGEYDQTNIVNNVPVAGITSLGLDHTSMLGNTIEEIARQKAGIMKKGSRVYTISQPPGAMDVLYKMAAMRQCSLDVVPNYNTYNWVDVPDVKMTDLDNPTKVLNASLAIQLAHGWMRRRSDTLKISPTDLNGNVNGVNIIMHIPKTTLYGLKRSNWAGRCQIVKRDGVHVYLDGAHTVESMAVCSKWFTNHCNTDSYKVLLFYVTKDRNPVPMMEQLLCFDFNKVIFVPDNATTYNVDTTLDRIDTAILLSGKVEKCKQYAEAWKRLKKGRRIEGGVVEVYSDIKSALDDVPKDDAKVTQVLVTGSLLLVGATLAVLNA